MTKFDFEIVGKIGSMALIRREENAVDYNVFSRIGEQLRPGMIWVSSGAVEIGRLDHMRRNNGLELLGDDEDLKTDYAAQGQAVLMENYRRTYPLQRPGKKRTYPPLSDAVPGAERHSHRQLQRPGLL